MKIILSLLVVILSSCITTAQNNPNNADTPSEYYFGFNLMPTFTGELITYAIVEVKNGVVVGAVPLEREQWFKYASGVEAHPANPQRINHFKENEVDSCWINYDAFYFKYKKYKYVGHECNAMDRLWKIRYKEHPSEYGLKGWSKQAYNPSAEQFAFLKKYYNIADQQSYCYGKDMYQLFRDMNDLDWPKFYFDADLTWESLKLSTDVQTPPVEEEDEEEETEEEDE